MKLNVVDTRSLWSWIYDYNSVSGEVSLESDEHKCLLHLERTFCSFVYPFGNAKPIIIKFDYDQKEPLEEKNSRTFPYMYGIYLHKALKSKLFHEYDRHYRFMIIEQKGGELSEQDKKLYSTSKVTIDFIRDLNDCIEQTYHNQVDFPNIEINQPETKL